MNKDPFILKSKITIRFYLIGLSLLGLAGCET